MTHLTSLSVRCQPRAGAHRREEEREGRSYRRTDGRRKERERERERERRKDGYTTGGREGRSIGGWWGTE